MSSKKSKKQRIKHQKKIKKYRYKAKLIRPYTDGFMAGDGYDLRKISQWSNGQKAEVTKVFNIIDGMLSGAPKHIYRPRNKKNLIPAQIASQQEQFSKKIKVAFIPTGDIEYPTRVRVRKERIFKEEGIEIGRMQSVVIKNENVFRRIINIDPIAMAIRTKEIITHILKVVKSKVIRIQAGKHEIGMKEFMLPYNPTVNDIVSKLRILMERYSANNFDPLNISSHYYGNWLHGLVAYDFGPQKDYLNYIIAKEDMRQRLKDLRRKEWRKRRRFFD